MLSLEAGDVMLLGADLVSGLFEPEKLFGPYSSCSDSCLSPVTQCSSQGGKMLVSFIGAAPFSAVGAKPWWPELPRCRVSFDCSPRNGSNNTFIYTALCL